MSLRQGNTGNMAMNRRNFLRVAAWAALATPLWVVRRKGPRVYVEALRRPHYPGPVIKADNPAMKKQGRWAG